MNEFITIEEIARVEGRSQGTIRRWLREKRITAGKKGGRWLVLREDHAQDLRDRPQTT